MTSMAQSNSVPKPLNPTVDEYIEYGGPEWGYYMTNFAFTVQTDLDGRYVDTTYNIEDDFQGTYVPLPNADQIRATYSVYTDFDKLYVFTPELFAGESIELPATEIPHKYEGMNFDMWTVHFPTSSQNPNNRLCKWRIGIQTHYYIGEEKNSSDIIYWNVHKWGDLNEDQEVDVRDVTALIDIIMNSTDNYLADLNDDGAVDVRDITMMIDGIMNEPPF